MVLQTKKVLITVKAPPNPSKKHQETNCCAGIDIDSGCMVRLYPIPFRLLDYSKKFPKYCIITVRCYKPSRDKRIESYKVDQDSIQIIRSINTKNKWEERKRIVLPVLSASFCRILDNIELNKSLGLFKPVDICFESKKSYSKKNHKSKSSYAQHTLFDRKLEPLAKIPFNFYYKFKCHDLPTCPGHKLKIHDWELSAAFRKWQDKYDSQEILLEKVKEKWLDTMCSNKRETYFYVGNMWQHPKQFMVLGVFWPPK